MLAGMFSIPAGSMLDGSKSTRCACNAPAALQELQLFSPPFAVEDAALDAWHGGGRIVQLWTAKSHHHAGLRINAVQAGLEVHPGRRRDEVQG
ncbi:MAG: hypothetical protein LBU32_06560 [Clostridiales bacterium]|nr:hypothetical protein [Clostridiales bacterium]